MTISGLERVQRQIIKRIAPASVRDPQRLYKTMTSVDLPKFRAGSRWTLCRTILTPEFKVCDLAPARHVFGDRSESRLLSRMRGVSSKFMVLEQQVRAPAARSAASLNGKIPDYLHPTPQGPDRCGSWCWKLHRQTGADGLPSSSSGWGARWPYRVREAHWNGPPVPRRAQRVAVGRKAKQLGKGKSITRIGDALTGYPACVFDRRRFLYDFDKRIARPDRGGSTGKHREASELSVVPGLVPSDILSIERAAPLSSVQEAGDLAGYQIVFFFRNAHVLGRAADVPPRCWQALRGRRPVRWFFGCWKWLPGSQPLVLRRGPGKSLLRKNLVGREAAADFYGW